MYTNTYACEFKFDRALFEYSPMHQLLLLYVFHCLGFVGILIISASGILSACSFVSALTVLLVRMSDVRNIVTAGASCWGNAFCRILMCREAQLDKARDQLHVAHA